MTPLEKLNRRMLQLETDGHLSEADYATYKDLLDGLSGHLETLYLSKDKDLLGSIEQARSLGVSGCSKELSW